MKEGIIVMKEACELHGIVWCLNALPEVLHDDGLCVEFAQFVRELVKVIIEWNC